MLKYPELCAKMICPRGGALPTKAVWRKMMCCEEAHIFLWVGGLTEQNQFLLHHEDKEPWKYVYVITVKY